MSSKRQKIHKPLGVSDDESAYLMRAGEEFAPTYLIGDDIEILTIKEKKTLLTNHFLIKIISIGL